MPCRKVFDRFMDEIGKRRIPRRSDIASRYWRSSRPHIRNCQPGYYRFGALRTDYTLIASQIAPTKSLRTWTDDELRALAKATKRNGARHTWRAPCFDHLRNPVCRRLGWVLTTCAKSLLAHLQDRENEISDVRFWPKADMP